MLLGCLLCALAWLRTEVAAAAHRAGAGGQRDAGLIPPLALEGPEPQQTWGDRRCRRSTAPILAAILSKAVEYHGFVYLQGVTAKDTSKDIKGQTADVLAQIDHLLEEHGTDKTRLLQALIWVKNIRDRDGMNEVWTPWLPKNEAPARACVQAELANPSILVEIMVTACK